jgi:hypothetical protein
MKTIRLKFADFPGPFNSTRIERLLRQRFDVVIDPDEPDYLIYSVRGYAHLQHARAIRIFFTGENIRPDFNICDYAFGYDWLEFGDRYHRWPNYQLYDQFKDLWARRRSPAPAGADLDTRGFCNFIYTSPNGHKFRDEVFHRLNRYRPVDSPGAHLRNMAADIGPAYQGDWSASKVDFQRRYRFSFAFENSSSIGYTTEKIVHALSADTIPIYWGNPEVVREFNSRRFVNCHELQDVEAIAQRVQELDSNPELYRAMLREPFFPDDAPSADLDDETILSWFEKILMPPKEHAYRRNFHAWGAHYEEQRIAEVASHQFMESRTLSARLARLLKRLG